MGTTQDSDSSLLDRPIRLLDELTSTFNSTTKLVNIFKQPDRINILTNPLSWTMAFRCFSTGIIFIFFTSCYLGYLLHGRWHPDEYPEINQVYWTYTFSLVAVGVVLLASLSAYIFKHLNDQRKSPPYLYAFIFGFTWILVFSTYFFGLFTNLYPCIAILSSWTIGLLLFPHRLIKISLCIVYLSVVLSAYLTQLDILPYAPFYNLPAIGTEYVSIHIFTLTNTISFFVLVVSSWLILKVIQYWGQQEARLIKKADDLGRANAIISRYLGQEMHDSVESEFGEYYHQSERKKLTMCCVDIDGFSHLADTLPTEDITLLLNSYWNEMTAIAKRYQASIESVMGDTIMIFLGAHEEIGEKEQALQAIRMGLEMQVRMRLLRDRWLSFKISQLIHIRIGINTGFANFSSHVQDANHLIYTALGQQVNLAAQLQAECPPDHIYISQTTWELVKDESECTLKGSIRNHQGGAIQFYDVDSVSMPETYS